MTEASKTQDNETEKKVNEETQTENTVKVEDVKADEAKTEEPKAGGWDAPEEPKAGGWDAPEEPKAGGWDAPAPEESKAGGWDAPAAEATTEGGWGASTSASAWDAPAPSVDTNNDSSRGNNDYRSRDSGRSYGNRDNNEGSGRDEYPRKRFDNDRSSSYGQDKRFRSERDDGDRRVGYQSRDRETSYGSRDSGYPPRGRDEGDRRGRNEGDRRGGYQSRDRDSGYQPRERDYPPRDRETSYGSRDSGYPPRGRDEGDRFGGDRRGRDEGDRRGGFQPRDSNYGSRDRDYSPRGRDEGDRFGGDRRGRDEGYPPRDRDSSYGSRDSGYERSSSRGRYDRDAPSTYDPMAENGQKSYESRPKKVIPENVPPSKTLGLFGLSLYATEEDLREFLAEELSDIKDFKLTIITNYETKESRGFGFVYFQCLEDSIKAKETLTGKSIKGKEIRVDYSVSDVLRPNYR